jgi:diguanylate cyclase (GGDEF)-like protein
VKPDFATLKAIAGHPLLIVVMHFLVLGSLFYWLYLRRALSALDPSAVIPERVRIAFNCMTEGVVILDRQGRVLMTNSAFDSLPMSNAHVIVGKKLSEIGWIVDSLRADASHPWVRTMEEGTASIGDLLVINIPPSGSRQLIVNCAPILNPESRVRGCVVTFDDVSHVYVVNERLTNTLKELQLSRAEIENKNAELEYAATHDSLSGCLPRSAGMAGLGAAMQQAKLDARPLLVLMLDIDKFKEVNDWFGHATGDKVIQAVGETLLSGVRDRDIVARHGGDEFVVTMFPCEAAQGLAIAQNLRQTITERCEKGIAALGTFRVSVEVPSVFRLPSDSSYAACPAWSRAAIQSCMN